MAKRKKPKFHLPEDRCVQILNKKSGFTKASFRYIRSPARGDEPSAMILIGCPKDEKRRDTNWKPKARKVITKRDGTKSLIVGVCEVGTRAHAKIQKPVRGRCRSGYKLFHGPEKEE
jgi:hypothetical protein